MTRRSSRSPPPRREIFGDRIDLARQFTAASAEHGEERGLIGPLEPPRLWTRHVLNSAVIAPLFSGRVGDVGSGAGLPGLVLAIARPDVEWVLIEPMERRVAWLTEQVDALGLDNVEVVRARAEDWRARTGAGCRHRARRQCAAHTGAPHRSAGARRRRADSAQGRECGDRDRGRREAAAQVPRDATLASRSSAKVCSTSRRGWSGRPFAADRRIGPCFT